MQCWLLQRVSRRTPVEGKGRVTPGCIVGWQRAHQLRGGARERRSRRRRRRNRTRPGTRAACDPSVGRRLDARRHRWPAGRPQGGPDWAEVRGPRPALTPGMAGPRCLCGTPSLAALQLCCRCAAAVDPRSAARRSACLHARRIEPHLTNLSPIRWRLSPAKQHH